MSKCVCGGGAEGVYGYEGASVRTGHKMGGEDGFLRPSLTSFFICDEQRASVCADARRSKRYVLVSEI
jgi:hypothetical protein